MKTVNIFTAVLLCSLCFSALIGCEQKDGDGPIPGMIYDVLPFEITINVVDEAGNCLLDPSMDNTLADTPVCAVYDGQEYIKDALTKEIKPDFKGLYTFQNDDGSYCLKFGELKRDENYYKEIVLIWNSGARCDTILMDHDFWWEGHDMCFSTKLGLNGSEPMESETVTIIMPAVEREWDFVPVNIEVMVQDADGNDLLNPETEGNISGNTIKAIFEGETYERDVDVATKAILVVFHGLLTDQYDSGEYAGRYYLKFGEFARDDNYEKEFVLDWGDGIKRDTVSFTQSCVWQGNMPETATTVSLNGTEPVDGNVVTIVMEPQPVNVGRSLADFTIKINNVSDIIITCRENDAVIY